MADRDESQELQARVRDAIEKKSPVEIRGGGSKLHLGHEIRGELLRTQGHAGIVSYEPTELVLTARSGTRLRDLEAALAEQGQMLPFEPPHLGPEATLGGAIACGLSGPGRFAYGSARDFVLGVRMLNGRGEIVRFGGQVMKNVAGYDLSRLMVGAYGTLGLLLDVSLKVLPVPDITRSMTLRTSSQEAIAVMTQLSRQAIPLTGAAWDAGLLHLRIAGSQAAINDAQNRLGEQYEPEETGWWNELREMRLPFFQSQRPLWRLSLPAASAPFALAGESLIDWAGAQRWFKSAAEGSRVFSEAEGAGGHARLWPTAAMGNATSVQLPPLAPGLLKLHQSVKRAMDPNGIFNPGRLYAEVDA